MVIEALQTVPNEILMEHLVGYANNPEAHIFEGNPHGTKIAQAFAETFEAFLEQDNQVQGLNLKAIPITTPELLELVDRTFKTDPRTTKEINGVPAALHGINPLSEERSAMVMAVVGDIPDGSGGVKKELVGLRSLTYASEQDIESSFGFVWDAEKGDFKRQPYSDFVEEGSRVLVRGWTYLVPQAGGVPIRGNGVGGVFEKATQAAALKLAKFNPDLMMMGEQKGLLPVAINRELDKLTIDGQIINIKNVNFPLFALLGYEGPEEALGKVAGIYAGGDVADIRELDKKFVLLGVDKSQYEQCLALDYPVEKLIGNGNPNADKMREGAIEMGLKPVPFMMSYMSAGRELTGGPVYVGEIINNV